MHGHGEKQNGTWLTAKSKNNWWEEKIVGGVGGDWGKGYIPESLRQLRPTGDVSALDSMVVRRKYVALHFWPTFTEILFLKTRTK